MTESDLPSAQLGARLDPYERLRALNLRLPEAPKPVANFVPAVREGSLLFLSGQGPIGPGVRHIGTVGTDVTVAEAYGHARLTCLNLLAVLEDSLGSLTRVKRIVKVFGMVNAAPSFAEHPKVINGCSDLLVEVFGAEVGRHARSAVGMGSLPGHITVEIELIASIRD
jgi:enamine deaminase RidA (YjgF/YER057c/UK114 family)